LGLLDAILERFRGLSLNASLGPRTLTIVAVVLLAATIGIAVRVLSRGGGEEVPKPQATLTCANCSHQWRADLTDAPVCPSCDAQAGIIPVSYRCDSCRNVFHGSDIKLVGPGDYRYRLVGSDRWVGFPPQRIHCPKCRRLLRDPDSSIIRGQSKPQPQTPRGDHEG